MANVTIGGRYVLCGEIASGGMATVHLARQIGAAGFARIVAVKRAHERFARDASFVAMFLDEARIVGRIRHPNVVQTIDVVAENGELFIVMDYVPGDSFSHLLRAARNRALEVPPRIAVGILVDALAGLHEAHEARDESGQPLAIVHRDVSPQNILIGVDGLARVLDFGVATARHRISTTTHGEIKGKLSYMAPEQISNGSVDRRTDVYAASVVLWEALAGRKLFRGSSEGAVVNVVMTGEVPPPSRVNGRVPPGLDDVVMRGLRRDIGERFSDAREMATALERAVSIAGPTEIGAFVQSVGADELARRSAMVSAIEAATSSSSFREAVESVRAISSRQSVSPRDSGSRSPGPSSFPRTAVAVVDPRVHPPPPVMTYAPPAPPLPATSGSGSSSSIRRGGVSTTALMAILGCSLFVVSGSILAALRARSRTPAMASAARRGAVEAGADATSVGVAPAVEKPSACPDGMVRVPAGSFFMGSDEDRPEEKPAHRVTLLSFCMDKFEVTAGEYKECSDRGDCKRGSETNTWAGITAAESRVYDPVCNGTDPRRARHPANCVDWSMASRFCKAHGKRLPTEAEWEYAANGSDGRRYPWGDAPPSARVLNACGSECARWGRKHGADLSPMYADDDGWPATAPVGSFPLGASRWGAEDIVGNVWEWVADWYGPYVESDQTDPSGPAEGTTKVIRGGAWNGSSADWVRPSYRFASAVGLRSHGIGFRCAMSAP